MSEQAIPTCSEGQVLHHDGENYLCLGPRPAAKIPDKPCPEGQVLMPQDGGVYSCVLHGTGTQATGSMSTVLVVLGALVITAFAVALGLSRTK